MCPTYICYGCNNIGAHWRQKCPHPPTCPNCKWWIYPEENNGTCPCTNFDKKACRWCGSIESQWEEITTQTGEIATMFVLAIRPKHHEEANTDVADGHCITPKLIISPNADPATHKIGDLYPKRFHRNIQSIPQNWKGTRPRGQPIPAHRY